MSWRNIRLIFLREVRDQLRDRRTLFMVAVLPLLLYPALGIGMVQMAMLFTEQPRTVVVLGAESLPESPPLLSDGRFIENWFTLPQDADKLDVVTDAPPSGEQSPEAATLLANAKRIRAKLEQRETLGEDEPSSNDLARQTMAVHSAQYERLTGELSDLFANSGIQVLILIPDGFGTHIEEVNRQLAERSFGLRDDVDYERPVIIRNSADEKSMIAYRRVRDALDSWEQEILKHRLDMADLPETLPSPVNPAPVDLAEEEQLAANLWSKLFPALLVIMAVTGAFYPAVDLAAGEKERGTMETLLICPATRTELVLGKFLTVMLFSMSTALLNLGSMGLTGQYIVSIASAGPFAKVGLVAFPSPLALFWIVVLLVPLAALFSALCLALATFARSTKEGQYYLTPLLLVTLGLTVFCLSPAVEIDPFRSIMPIMGIALLLKGLLLNSVSIAYAIPVLATSMAYSGLALWWAIEQFKREDVLFREAERFELRLWLRHLLRDKEPTPSFTEAGFCFVLIMFLQFAALKVMQQAFFAGQDDLGTTMMKLLLIQQLVIIASPALFMGVMLTTSMVRTFRLRPPKLGFFGVAVLLPFALHPLSLELVSSLSWFFPQLPESATSILQAMADPGQPWWFVLLTFAAAPAICEELAYRGFILSGFCRSGRLWLGVILSSLTFGIMHLIPQQVFNATLLGLVLGWLAIRSQSLLPGIAFHFVYNSLGVLHGRIGAEWVDDGLTQWFFASQEGALRYQWPTLVVAGLAAIVMLRWLAHQTDGATSASTAADVTPEALIGTCATGKPSVGV